MKIHPCSLFCATMFAVLGCGGPSTRQHDHPKALAVAKKHTGSYPIKAIGTTGMVADLVRHVGGKHVAVEQLFAADVDPHLYKPTPADTSKLAAANVIFYSGIHLEGKMIEVFESLSRKQPCIGVGDHLDPKEIHKDEEGASDPHVWFDVALWSKAAGVVRDALALYDPGHAGDYQAQCASYQKELDELHGEVQKRLAEVPVQQRVLVTSHDAFRYFGRAYQVEVKGVQGISTEAQASVRDISDLVGFLVERKVKAVFVESSVNPRNMRALIEGCAAKGHQVTVGGELFSDAMGKAGTPEGTYIGMIRHNVETIIKALK